MKVFTLTYSGKVSLAWKSLAFQVLWSSGCKGYQHHIFPCSCLLPEYEWQSVNCFECFKSLPMKITIIVKSKIRTSTNFWKMWRTFMSVCPTCMSRRSLPYLSTISEYGQLVVSVFTSDLSSTSNLLASATIESNKMSPETGENIPLTSRWE